MSKKKKPETIYAACVNRAGLWSKKPIICKLNNDPFGNCITWWSENGDFNVYRLGITINSGNIVFASINKKEVQIWINGVRAAITLLNDWSWNKF